MEFAIRRIGLRGALQILDGFWKIPRRVIAEAQKCDRLQALRIGRERGFQRLNGTLKFAALEFREPQIHLHTGEFRIQCQRFGIGRGRIFIFLFAR